MAQWSVLLVYPDYMVEGYGPETYYTHVDGETVQDAIAVARADCMADNADNEGTCCITEPTDLLVLLVTAGSHPDRKFETTEVQVWNS